MGLKCMIQVVGAAGGLCFDFFCSRGRGWGMMDGIDVDVSLAHGIANFALNGLVCTRRFLKSSVWYLHADKKVVL